MASNASSELQFSPSLDRPNVSRILLDPNPFELSWVPPEILHRESQIAQLESIWTEAIQRAAPRHATLQGDYGTGKTAVAKFVARKVSAVVSDQDRSLSFAYVPCSQFDSTSRVLREAVHQVTGVRPSGGLPKSDYIARLQSEAQTRKAVILILDDADRFILKEKSDPEIIFAIPSRIITNLSLALITNSYKAIDWLRNELDTRFQDTFQARPIGFGDYKPGELADILQKRVTAGYKEETFEIGEITYAARRCYELGLRARGLIKVGGLVGKLAQSKGEDRVSVELIEDALHEIRRQEDVQPIIDLDPASRAILFKIFSEGSISTESLLVWFETEIAGKRIRGLSSKTFYSMSKRLKDLGLLAATKTSRGKERRWTEILTINSAARDLVAEAYHQLPTGNE